MKSSVSSPPSEINLDVGFGQSIQLDPREDLLGGLSIQRVFTKEGLNPYENIDWERRDVVIMDWKTGKPSYERKDVEVPSFWAENALKITASKYLFGRDPDTPEYEDSLRHAFDRIANTYTVWGWRHGYFASKTDAVAYNHELKYLLAYQMWAPNSPVWFNIGHWEQWRWGRPDLRATLDNRGNKAYKATIPEGDLDDRNLEVKQVSNAYTHPQASACFLMGIEDSMEKILSHQIAEGGVFSSGSGIGVNLSSIRSSKEPIMGKGFASGPISFDKGFDRMAGAIKSGGKTRRAARMVLLFADHPDIFQFISAKNEQENIGKIILREHNVSIALKKKAEAYATTGSPAERMAARIVLDMPIVTDKQYDSGMDDLLYGETLAHQNANHSVSLKGDFWKAYQTKGEYQTRWVSDPNKIEDTVKAEDILDAIAECVWHNAEPGTHNNDFINIWNPVKSDGDISTSNPCSEYLHLNFTSCNLSSFNVFRFYDRDTKKMRVDELQKAVRLAMIAADLNIEEGGFPISEIAAGTYRYRTTGIGYANIGGLLMAMGIPYDSDEGRLIASQLVSLLTSTCWKASAEMGLEFGAYPRFEATKADLREILELHKAIQDLSGAFSQGKDIEKEAEAIFKKRSSRLPMAQGLTALDVLRGYAKSFEKHSVEAPEIAKQLQEVNAATWTEVIEAKRFRNSFTTVMAPTGTISAPMGVYDEGTTSAEPDYTLVKYKNLSGGGMLKMFNTLALEGLRTQGYSTYQVREAALEVAGLDGLFTACNANMSTVARHLQKALDDKQIGPIRRRLNDLIGFKSGDASKFEAYLAELHEKGQNATATQEETAILAGASHVEDIPWLKPEHKGAFDCSATSGTGTRSISPKGHMHMLGAIQPFLSGATSKTVNLPYTASREDIKQCLVDCHDMGVKCVALYRADSKGISVYNVDTPEGRKWNPEYIWEGLVEGVRQEVSEIVKEASKPQRVRLPGRRISQTLKFEVGGGLMEGFLTVGIYPDGSCGEVFGRVGQAGSFANGMFESFCKSFSISLQYGVPLSSLIESFRYTAFDPSGFTRVGDQQGVAEQVKSCKSVVDAMMQILQWLFPESNDERLIDYPVNVEHVARTESGDVTVKPALSEVSHLQASIQNKSAESCPKCGSMSYVHDGRCRSCRDCGYKDGGCGE